VDVDEGGFEPVLRALLEVLPALRGSMDGEDGVWMAGVRCWRVNGSGNVSLQYLGRSW